jgi:hypothetical protein
MTGIGSLEIAGVSTTGGALSDVGDLWYYF